MMPVLEAQCVYKGTVFIGTLEVSDLAWTKRFMSITTETALKRTQWGSIGPS